jgi:hypothetical protein
MGLLCPLLHLPSLSTIWPLVYVVNGRNRGKRGAEDALGFLFLDVLGDRIKWLVHFAPFFVSPIGVILLSLKLFASNLTKRILEEDSCVNQAN